MIRLKNLKDEYEEVMKEVIRERYNILIGIGNL